MHVYRLRPWGVFAVAGAVLCVFTAGHAPRVLAHASYVSSNPADRQVLATAPRQLTITFVSAIAPAPGTFATVTSGDTDAVAGDALPSPTDPITLVVPLKANLPGGKYIVFWKSTDADDGGVTFGQFSFFVGNVSQADAAAAQPGVSVAVPDEAKDQALTDVAGGDAQPSSGGVPPASTQPSPASTPWSTQTTSGGR